MVPWTPRKVGGKSLKWDFKIHKTPVQERLTTINMWNRETLRYCRYLGTQRDHMPSWTHLNAHATSWISSYAHMHALFQLRRWRGLPLVEASPNNRVIVKYTLKLEGGFIVCFSVRLKGTKINQVKALKCSCRLAAESDRNTQLISDTMSFQTRPQNRGQMFN